MRALAQAAARAGFTPCAIDGFADRDTRLACQGRALRLPARGCVPDWALLDDAIGEMRRRHAPRGFAGAVAGGGLEACPELLDVLRRHAPLANADKEAVLVAATPARWFALLDEIGAPHPKVSLGGTPNGPGWLVKHAGGTGGLHVRPWRPGMALEENDYCQQRASGQPGSALFLAADGEARIVGWQRQLIAPSAALPFRHGGVACDDALPTKAKASIATIVEALARRLPLCGLAGLDFLADGGDVRVLELNPRPTASLALYPASNLFALHLDACAGRELVTVSWSGQSLPPAVTRTRPSPPRQISAMRRPASIPPRQSMPASTTMGPSPLTFRRRRSASARSEAASGAASAFRLGVMEVFQFR